MNELMQITGLGLQDLSEITGFLLTLISLSVFIGILMFDLYEDICAFIRRSIRSFRKFILERKYYGKKSRS